MTSETSKRKAMKVANCSEPAITPNKQKIQSIRKGPKQDFCFVESKWISIHQNKLNQRLAKRIRVNIGKFSADKQNSKNALRREFGALESASNVRELDLHSNSCDTTDAELYYITKSLRGLQSLKTIDIDLQDNEWVEDAGLGYLGHALKPLKLLIKDLKLDFTRCETLGDGGMQSLSKALKNKVTLKTLDLNLEGCKEISERGMESFGEALGSLASLIIFKLNLSGKPNFIEDEGTESLARGLKYLIYLQEVEIILHAHLGVGDDAMKRLGRAFEAMPSIEKIKLDFETCEYLTDNGIKNLCQGFKNLQSLENLDLCFATCVKITEKAMKSLGESLKNLQSLKKLKINLSECSDEGRDFWDWPKKSKVDLGLKNLGQNLKKLPSLQDLVLDFSYSEELTDKGMLDIAKSLKNLDSLRSIFLDFTVCPKITKAGKESAKKILHENPNLVVNLG